MKLTVLGGGGVRSPFLSQVIARRAKILNISKIVFMDTDIGKLNTYGMLAKMVSMHIEPELEFDITTDPVEALQDADFIITTLRVGGDEARTLDERIALRYGLLGQETTGAGGFAMAMRSIPEISKYCKMAKEYSKPGTVIFNFTNPSGLVTQAIRDEGYNNFYGICDGPSGFIREIAHMLHVKADSISTECFGLNHLSWFRSIKVNKVEMINDILLNPLLFKETENSLFDPELVKDMGMLLNGYLYYYYHREKAIENISKAGKTRGETILEINRKMEKELSKIDICKNFKCAVEIYLKFMEYRKNSYMSIESESTLVRSSGKHTLETLLSTEDEGYAGVALGIMEGLISGRSCEAILSVPNKGAIEGLADNDIVEVTCKIGLGKVQPLEIGKVPEIQMSLIRQVKLYERLAAQAIREGDIRTAIRALMIHPLVNSYSLAKSIVHDYIDAHGAFIGKWK